MRILTLLSIVILLNACTSPKEHNYNDNLSAKRDSIHQSKKDSIFRAQQRELFLKDSLKTADSLSKTRKEKTVDRKKESKTLKTPIPEFTAVFYSYVYSQLDKNLPKRDNGDGWYNNDGQTDVQGKIEFKDGRFCFYQTLYSDAELCDVIEVSEEDEETGQLIFTGRYVEVTIQFSKYIHCNIAYNFDRKYQLYSDLIQLRAEYAQ